MYVLIENFFPYTKPVWNNLSMSDWILVLIQALQLDRWIGKWGQYRSQYYLSHFNLTLSRWIIGKSTLYYILMYKFRYFEESCGPEKRRIGAFLLSAKEKDIHILIQSSNKDVETKRQLNHLYHGQKQHSSACTDKPITVPSLRTTVKCAAEGCQDLFWEKWPIKTISLEPLFVSASF